MQAKERARFVGLLSASVDFGALAPILRTVYGPHAAGELPISNSRNAYFDAFVEIVENHGVADELFVHWMRRLRKPWRYAAKVRDLAMDLGVSVDVPPRIQSRTKATVQRAMPFVLLLAAVASLLPFMPPSVPCSIAIVSYEGIISGSKKVRAVARVARQYGSVRVISAASCVESVM